MGAGHRAPARAHPPLGHELLLGTFLLDDISQGIEKIKKKRGFFPNINSYNVKKNQTIAVSPEMAGGKRATA